MQGDVAKINNDPFNPVLQQERLRIFCEYLATDGRKETLPSAVYQVLKDFFPLRDFAIDLYDEATATHQLYLHYAAHTPVKDDAILMAVYPASDPFFAPLITSKYPLEYCMDEIPDGPEMPAYIKFWQQQGIRKIVAVRLQYQQSILGGLYLCLPENIFYSTTQLQFLQLVSYQVGAVLKNILTQDIIEKRAVENDSLLELNNRVAALRESEIKAQLEQIIHYRQQLEAENLYLQEQMKTSYHYNEMVGASDEMQQVYRKVSMVATSSSTVLLLGETGTGKELIARAIHNSSNRKDKLMIKVNCAALPAHLVESELFGHEKGSFTGAVERRIGKFELANNSTIFLDEIGEMPLELQVKLLRAIQEREIERIGGKGPIKTDVRIIAATNRDLEKEAAAGKFRSDLFYRLNVFPVELPPLRMRKDDIPLLASHFIHKFSHASGKKIEGLSSNAMKEIMHYHWPGNVRELEHFMERSVLLTEGGVIDKIHLPVSERIISAAKIMDDLAQIKTIDEVERDYIMQVLDKCKGRIRGAGGAAELLKLPPTTLHSKIKKLGIKKWHA